MDNIKRCWDYAVSVPSPQQMSGIHGISHWKRVQKFGLQMADTNPDIDPVVVSLFACFHDFQRTDNGRDFTHGPRAADALVSLRDSLLSFLSDEQFARLTQACREHTERTSPSGDITVDTCIDSDRLDLSRIGITPDPARMLSPQGRNLAALSSPHTDSTSSPGEYNGTIIQHIEEHILPLCPDVDLAIRRINAAVREAELRKLDGLKMFVISSYASLTAPDIISDPYILNWFTKDEARELQNSLSDHLSKRTTTDPFALILNDVFTNTQ